MMSLNSSPAGPPALSSPCAITSGVQTVWLVRSRPIITNGTPEVNTTRAASGSAKMLNSADGVSCLYRKRRPLAQFHGFWAGLRGCIRIATAIFESGPTGTRVISPSLAIRVSMMYFTAWVFSAWRVSGSNTGPSGFRFHREYYRQRFVYA